MQAALGQAPRRPTVCLGSSLKRKRSCFMPLFKLELWGWRYLNQSKYFFSFQNMCWFCFALCKLSETLCWIALVDFERIVFVWVELARRRVNFASWCFPHLKGTLRSQWHLHVRSLVLQVWERKLPAWPAGSWPQLVLITLVWPHPTPPPTLSPSPLAVAGPLSSFDKTSGGSASG